MKLKKRLNVYKDKLLLLRNRRNFTVENAHTPIPSHLTISFCSYLRKFDFMTAQIISIQSHMKFIITQCTTYEVNVGTAQRKSLSLRFAHSMYCVG